MVPDFENFTKSRNKAWVSPLIKIWNKSLQLIDRDPAWQLFLHSAYVILIKISFLHFLKIRTGPIFYDFWSGPVRSFVGTVRTDILYFYENFVWTLYFFNFSKFWSVPRTVPIKNPFRYGFFRTKIRTTYRTRFESGPNIVPRTVLKKIRTENPYHVPDH